MVGYWQLFILGCTSLTFANQRSKNIWNPEYYCALTQPITAPPSAKFLSLKDGTILPPKEISSGRIILDLQRLWNQTMAGWWFGCHFLDFPIYWVSNHPNWLSYFSERWPNHQPDEIRQWDAMGQWEVVNFSLSPIVGPKGTRGKMMIYDDQLVDVGIPLNLVKHR